MSGSMRDLFQARADVDGTFNVESASPSAPPNISRKKADKQADSDRKRLARLQDRLSAEGTRSLLLVLQGMDTSGKDGTIKHVIGSMNPGGCRVVSFKAPTDEERKHDFLWRIRRALPAPSQVGVFNRSHYEDVLVARVDNLVSKDAWQPRYKRINAFEKSLTKNGVTIVKVFLHISRDEQKKRILKRLENPEKRWKFNEKDLDHRDTWDEYMGAYSDAIRLCSTAAPWFVIPANAKWFRNWAIGRLLVETLQEMDPRYPQPELDVETIKARLDGHADVSEPPAAPVASALDEIQMAELAVELENDLPVEDSAQARDDEALDLARTTGDAHHPSETV
ncbi:MAG: PPK2 family polyphosphate kinase [Actinomycetota bacterium]